LEPVLNGMFRLGLDWPPLTLRGDPSALLEEVPEGRRGFLPDKKTPARRTPGFEVGQRGITLQGIGELPLGEWVGNRGRNFIVWRGGGLSDRLIPAPVFQHLRTVPAGRCIRVKDGNRGRIIVVWRGGGLSEQLITDPGVPRRQVLQRAAVCEWVSLAACLNSPRGRIFQPPTCLQGPRVGSSQ
jgi:hypothetical protein